jgi:hypothetical protein
MAVRHIIGAACAGALCMYFLDPQQGRGRRAALRQRSDALRIRLDNIVSVAARDLGHRTRGLAHEARLPRSGPAVTHGSWSPAGRTVAGTVGCALLGYALLVSRLLPALLGAATGFGLLLRSATNMPLDQLLARERHSAAVRH